jgi:hypothetical protein
MTGRRTLTDRMLMTDRRTPTVRKIMRDWNILTDRRIIVTDRDSDGQEEDNKQMA